MERLTSKAKLKTSSIVLPSPAVRTTVLVQIEIFIEWYENLQYQIFRLKS